MENPIEAVIEKVSLKPNKIQPIIVNFQNGELKDAEALQMECGLYQDTRARKQVLALSNGHVVYKGYRPEPEQALTYTMLAIHNKRTGKVRLVQAERWQVAPILDKEMESDVREDHTKMSQLNKQFGSKKVKRRTEQIERMQINVDMVKDQLEKSVSKVDITRTDLSLPSMDDDSAANTNLPECNRAATRVEDVYDANDIIPRVQLETLYESCETVLEQGIEGESKFFNETLEVLKSRSDKMEKIAMLLYINSVAKWLRMPIKDARKKQIEICPFSSVVNNHIIQSYSMPSTGGRARPNSMKDKGIVHIIVLGLIISNFTLNLELLTTLFQGRIGIKKLLDMARFLNAVPLKNKKTTVVLKLPLPPKLAAVKKGKKKTR